jgi:hypothetical protein
MCSYESEFISNFYVVYGEGSLFYFLLLCDKFFLSCMKSKYARAASSKAQEATNEAMLQAIYTSSKVKFHRPIKISVAGLQNKIIHLLRIYFRLSNVTALELFPRQISLKHFIAFLYNVLFSIYFAIFIAGLPNVWR